VSLSISLERTKVLSEALSYSAITNVVICHVGRSAAAAGVHNSVNDFFSIAMYSCFIRGINIAYVNAGSNGRIFSNEFVPY
jgi:hypothetical protein